MRQAEAGTNGEADAMRMAVTALAALAGVLGGVDAAEAATVDVDQVIEANWNVVPNEGEVDPFRFHAAVLVPYDDAFSSLADLSFRISFVPGRTPAVVGGPGFVVPQNTSVQVGDGPLAQANGLVGPGAFQALSGTLDVALDGDGDLVRFAYWGDDGFSIVDGLVTLPDGRTFTHAFEQSYLGPSGSRASTITLPPPTLRPFAVALPPADPPLPAVVPLPAGAWLLASMLAGLVAAGLAGRAGGPTRRA